MIRHIVILLLLAAPLYAQVIFSDEFDDGARDAAWLAPTNGGPWVEHDLFGCFEAGLLDNSHTTQIGPMTVAGFLPSLDRPIKVSARVRMGGSSQVTWVYLWTRAAATESNAMMDYPEDNHGNRGHMYGLRIGFVYNPGGAFQMTFVRFENGTSVESWTVPVPTNPMPPYPLYLISGIHYQIPWGDWFKIAIVDDGESILAFVNDVQVMFQLPNSPPGVWVADMVSPSYQVGIWPWLDRDRVHYDNFTVEALRSPVATQQSKLGDLKSLFR